MITQRFLKNPVYTAKPQKFRKSAKFTSSLIPLRLCGFLRLCGVRGSFSEASYRLKTFFLFSVFCFLFSVLTGCGSRYQAERLYWQAEQEVKRIVQNKPPDKLTGGDYEKIVSLYRQVVNRCPLEPLAAQSQFIIAQIYILEGKFSKAEEELVKIIQNFSTNPELASRAQFIIGNLYEQQGDWDKAILEYEKITDLYPLSGIGLKIPIYVAEHYQRNKEILQTDKAYYKAIKDYNKLIDDYSGTSIVPLVKNYLASTYVSQGKWDEAIDIWQAILNESPQSQLGALSLFAIGETYERQIKDLQKAIEVYEDFVAKYPQSQIIKQTKFQIGRLYFLKRDFTKARTIFEEIIKEYPREKELCANAELAIASCYESEGGWDEAMQRFREITTNYPDSKVALQVPLFIAQHYLKENRTADAEKAFQEALSGYEKIIRDNPNTPLATEAQDLISLSYISQQDWTKAIDSLEVLVEKYPNDPRAITSLFTMAAIYQKQLNSPEEALKIYEDFIERYPRHILTNLARDQVKSLQTLTSKQNEN